ncbi:hypothetical protein QR680_012405 [Steinernema hermaphroditum]|uniref:RING-type E3 ubiquitin transferase n=1 Tax=Steinernema hermaphroditum TaxID=289476 RepID=A0AA39I1X9_9BILA|nr:hypothetical protein QR680_012405 [Steinernema hermaphroditum]
MAPVGQGMLWSEILCCPVCSELFSARHLPINLSCGHALCKPCLESDKAMCPYDETAVSMPVSRYPVNVALLRILNVSISLLHSSNVREAGHIAPLEKLLCRIAGYLSRADSERGGSIYSEHLSRPVQRKLVFLLSFQLIEREGRVRSLKSCRSIADRIFTEVVMSYQSSSHTCTMLWSAVRARGCQFLGPAMQEDVLKLIHLALSNGETLARKTLVLYIVEMLKADYPQVSKTCVGHVVQLLYRASCFNVFKREGESSLMELKEEFRNFEALRREHDAQIVQIATEAGLRISPDQWSSLLYGDAHHRSHMQSIIDKQHAAHGHTFTYPLTELDDIVDHHPADAGFLHGMRENFAALEALDCSVHDPSWPLLEHAFSSLADLIDRHVIFTRKRNADRQNGSAFGRRDEHGKGSSNRVQKYKTQACKIVMSGMQCPRGDRCNFAHDVLELRGQQNHPVDSGRRPSQSQTQSQAGPPAQRNFPSEPAGTPPTAPKESEAQVARMEAPPFKFVTHTGRPPLGVSLSSYTPQSSNHRPPVDPMQPDSSQVHKQPMQQAPIAQQLQPQPAQAVVPVMPLLIPGAQGAPEMMQASVMPPAPVPVMPEAGVDGSNPPPQAPPYFMIAHTVRPPVGPAVATMWTPPPHQNPTQVPTAPVVPVMAPGPPHPPSAQAAWMPQCNSNAFIAMPPSAAPAGPPTMGVMHPSNGSLPFRFEGSDGVTYFEDSFCPPAFPPPAAIPVAPGPFLPRYPLMPQPQPASYCIERLSEAQSNSNSSSNKSHWEMSESEQLQIRRDEIITRLHKTGLSNIDAALGYDDGADEDDSKEHVSYTVANAVLFDEKEGQFGAMVKKLELPPLPARYNSFLRTSTGQQLDMTAAVTNAPNTLTQSTVRTVCPTTFVRGVTAPPATVQADITRMKVRGIIDQPLATPMIQLSQALHPSTEVIDPGHLADRLPSVIRPLPPTPRDPQNVVSSTLDRIVDVRERIQDVHMNRGIASAAEKQQLDVELNIVSRGIQSLDRQTKQVCLLKELKAVDEKIEHLNVNA